MWWRLQKKIIFNHPYFECNPDVVLSRKEAGKVFDSGFPTFTEMIDGAKERFDVPQNTWDKFDEAIQSLKDNKSHRNFIAGHKRLAIVSMVILLVISFFTLIPFGRALAADFFNMIMRIINGRIEITSENPNYEKYEFVNLVAEQYNRDNEGGSEPDNNRPIFYPDIDKFVSETGFKPVTISTDWLECQTIHSLDDDDMGLTITVQYLTTERFFVVTSQKWNYQDGIVFQVEDETYNKTKIFGDTDFFYAIDSEDGSFAGTAVLDDSLMIIGAEKGVDIERLLKTLK